MKPATVLFIAGSTAVVLVAVGTWLWQRSVGGPFASLTPESLPVATAPAASAPPAAPSAPASGAAQYPIESAAAASAPVPGPTLETSLTTLFGRQAVLGLFQLDSFPRRLTATVDNLGRRHAPAQVWPLNPAPGRFLVGKGGGAEFIDADNGARYTPYVLLIEQVDLPQLVATYTRLYPQFQQAYEDLGFPGRYFNDRLVQVIDLLLATPEPAGVLKVHLPPINTPMPAPRPWVLYEFDDPALQGLTAGQKILLRMGVVNERRVKARLAELRKLLTARPAAG
ncbi:DUF3014 domain-containing protein [Ideonella sp.]|uniref:DUF3014 domain-containing protein n=1 Tax=Ideonella sp. TaxID=1929293 RepID=UPI002B485A95|nr:DUF3014 domain-containing protein [Ideonella sp.]HJV67663.1 DUF3014 domain-containing protein [Ideonella sp.]